MTPVSGSSGFFQNDLRALYLYGPHVLLAALAAVFMDTTILWEPLPKTPLLLGIVCYSSLSFYALFLIARAGHAPTLKIRKTCRLLRLLSLLLALCWGSSVLLITNDTLLVYAHSLFLFCICGLFSTYLAALPIMAYCFLAIGLAPILFILFFKAPAYMTPLAYSLLTLTLLQVSFICFYSKTLRTATRRCHHTQLPPHKLGIRLQRSHLALS